VRGDGTVVGWGSNGDGRAEPPAGLSGVVGIAAGGAHSLALVRATATLVISPSIGFAGTPITVTGGGFAPNETIEVVYRQGGTTMDAATAPPTSSGQVADGLHHENGDQVPSRRMSLLEKPDSDFTQ